MASHLRQRKDKCPKRVIKTILIILLILAAIATVVFFVLNKDSFIPERETMSVTIEETPAEYVEETIPESLPIIKVEQTESESVSEPETEPVPEYKPEITLTFAGDILFDPNYAIMASMLQRGGDITTSFDEGLMEIMTGSDLFMLNNEFPYSDRGEPLPEKQFTFRAKPEYVTKLLDIGVDIVGLANNHLNDHGQDAMLDTFDILDSAGIPYVGAGRNIEEANKPYYIELEGVKIAFVAATQIERLNNPDTVAATETSPGVFRCLDPTGFIDSIKEAKENSDFVVAFVHWGTEGTEKTDWYQDEQAPLYAGAGADLIIGDHPHVLQKIDIVEGVPCIYSLGNYLFNSSSLDTCLVQATIDTESKTLKSFRFIPAYQSGCKTKKLDGSEKERVIRYMRSLSDSVEIDDEGYLYLSKS
ncbi:MAG: CapA family protein [Lachnospiraceae bacterium]|nr:CapA family protein [Lachnospiraceae bacterium]